MHLGPALYVAIFLPLFLAFLLPLVLYGEQAQLAQEKAKARRMAEHRINARVLRLDI